MLRPSERKVADLILQRPLLATGLAIAEIAAQAGVSEPTVIRFCRSLGLSGYAELRRLLLRDLERRAPPVHRVHDAPMADELAAAVALLAQADTLALDCASPEIAAAAVTDLTDAGFRFTDASGANVRVQITRDAISLSNRDGDVVILPSPPGRALDRVAAQALTLSALIARAAPANADKVQAARETAQAAAHRAFLAGRRVAS